MDSFHECPPSLWNLRKAFASFQVCLCHNRLVHAFPSTDELIASATLSNPGSQSHSLKYTIEGSSTNPGGLTTPPLLPRALLHTGGRYGPAYGKAHPAWHKRRRGVRENRKALRLCSAVWTFNSQPRPVRRFSGTSTVEVKG
jgi:hypothetical protein